MWAFTIGRVVRRRWTQPEPPLTTLGNSFGHVTGFGRNELGETTVKVKWDSGSESVHHPALLCLED